MIYTSGTPMTREDLLKVPVPERENVSDKWQGVNHGELANTIVEYVHDIGLGVMKENWFVSPNLTGLYGGIEIDGRGTDFELEIGQAANYSIGVRHDNAGRYAVSLAMGAVVTVCSNGLFTGDHILKSRHYDSLNLRNMVAEGVEQWLSDTKQVENFIEMMQTVPIDDKDASYIILKSSEKSEGENYNCINFAYLEKVYRNWKTPPHQEFEERNLWALYNAFTETGKELSPPRQFKLLKNLKPLMMDYVQEGLH